MYQLLAFLNGAMIALIVSSNGTLSASVGSSTATTVIFLVGSVLAVALYYAKRGDKRFLGHRLRTYLGGPIGIGTTVSQTLAVPAIGASGVVALSLLGEVVVSIVYDTLGVFGSEKRPFPRHSIPGLLVSAAGIAVLASGSTFTQVWAIALALLSGFTIVTSRTMNATLLAESNVYVSTLSNYITALPFVVVGWLALGGSVGDLAEAGRFIASNPYAVVGGVLSVVSVGFNAVLVHKIPALVQTQLAFVGQLAGSFALDLLLGVQSDPVALVGKLLIAAGILINVAVDALRARK